MQRGNQRHLWFWLGALLCLLAAVAVFKEILLPFVAGMVIAYFLNPVADRLQAIGIRRTMAAGLIIGIAGVALVLALVFLLPLLGEQIRQMLAALPGEFERLKSIIESHAQQRLGEHFPGIRSAIERSIADWPQAWAGSVGAVAAAIWNRGLALVNVVSVLLITPLVTFYLLVDWHRMLERVETYLPRDHTATISMLAHRINDAVSAFIRGQGVICIVLGCFYAAGLTWAGLNYGLVIGLATGLLGFVPVLGWVLGLIVASALALLQFGGAVLPVVKVIAVLAAGLVLDTAVLSPRFVGQKVGLHPVWLIFALFAFSFLFGFVGTLVAVPVAAAVAVLVRHGLQLYLESDYYRGETAAGQASGHTVTAARP